MRPKAKSKFFLFWFCVPLMFVYNCAYSDPSLITSNVHFRQAFSGLIGFTDGSSVEIMDPNFQFRPIWKVGDKLEIRFSPSDGVTLYDPEHHLTYQILELYGRPHPIDLWLQRCYKKKQPNRLWEEGCRSHAENMWLKLIRFDYKLVAHNEPRNTLLKGFNHALAQNERDWNLYRQSFSAVAGDSFKMWGTYWPGYQERVYLAFLRNQDRVVLSLLGRSPLDNTFQHGPKFPTSIRPISSDTKHLLRARPVAAASVHERLEQ